MGGYDETPDNFGQNVKKFAMDGLVNMVGGCCGTTPEYIAALKIAVNGV
jgi:5-methyltetrahydrofolate--homocysteine methyltransferase